MRKKTEHKKKTRRTHGRLRDPHAVREAGRYDRPIASREWILTILNEAPLSLDALAARLELREATDLEALRRRVAAMLRDGQLIENRRGELCPAERIGIVTGTVIGHRDGFGFLVPDTGGEDVFLPARQMRALMHGDRAAVRIQGRDARGRPEGSLVDVLERRTHELVGRFHEEHGVCFVRPDNSRYHQDVLVPPQARGDARPGQIVIVAIEEQPTRQSQPIGRVTRILGDHRAPGMEVEIAIHSHGLPHEWPEAVRREAEAFAPEVPEDAKRGRLDLRGLALVTIDGADARDFDDAVYAEPAGDGWRLIVAIADVSHYVRPGSALDEEARNRATSVYFPDWVIPMLPEVLSNGLCSLNPLVDRLCIACEMRIGRDGRVTRARFHEAVMRSAARLTYEEVGALFEGEPAMHRRLGHLVPRLDALRGVYRALAAARRARGAIDFDKPETKIVFGEGRRIREILPVHRNDAHRLIEECMIAANVEAARFLKRHKIPTLYRVHDRPAPDKVQALREFLGPLGLRLGGGAQPDTKEFARLLARAADRPDRHLIETVTLRTLAQAAYSPTDIGHFGLAHVSYLHFTSPIRRYPDLLVHRGIRHVLRGGTAEDFPYDMRTMEALGHHCSMAERRADEATWDAIAWLKCEYMESKVGEEFEGLITAVVPFGFFVELKDLYVEGLVHVTSLTSDYYVYDAAGHRLYGERSGREYRLADPVRVRVARVDLDERKIDFVLVDESLAPRRGRGGRPRRAKRGAVA
ncbi:MAG TPA: ribonuclease R [Gammaproteobacteria bacterium]|nr:ribonuclease R [Gammaproteobacteria bacterium]